MINNLALSRLSHAELYQFLKIGVGKVVDADPVVLKLNVASDLLVAILPRLLAALNKEVVNEETKFIIALEKKRDRNIIGLTANVKSYLYHDDEAKNDAARLLGDFIDAQSKGTTVSRQNYSTESASILKITSTFKTDPKYVAAVTLLGATEWVVNLETANTQFDDKYGKRITIQSEDKDVPAFGQVREEAIPLYEELTGLIVSRFTTAKADGLPTEAYQKLINEFNILIAANAVYTLPRKPKDKPADPA